MQTFDELVLIFLVTKSSMEELVQRMTSALLPGFYAHIHPETQQPCVLQSADSTDYVQGMVVFGQGKQARNLIHQHYRRHARRVKLEVEIDVCVPVEPPLDLAVPSTRWRLQRRKVWAHAWLWSDTSIANFHFGPEKRRWTLEDYLHGTLAPPQTLRIEPDGKGDERNDSDGSDAFNGLERAPKQRPVIRSGCGHLDYERTETFSGW